MKARDGRTVRGELIREEVREQILNRYVELLRAGTPLPTASQIAKHARLSRRVIFKHFADLGQLRVAAFDRVAASSRAFFLQPIDDDLPADERLRLLIRQQTAMLEAMAPFRRMALLMEHTDPAAAAVLKRVRAAAVRDIERAVHPALGRLSASEKRNLLLALHMICAWPSWETLRSVHGLGRRAARAVITRSALATLKSAVRDNGAAPGSARLKSGVHRQCTALDIRPARS
jgi:AcrR family transcriptional regulator